MLRGSFSKALHSLTEELKHLAGRPARLEGVLNSSNLRLNGPLAQAEGSIDASSQMPWELLAEAAEAAEVERRSARKSALSGAIRRSEAPIAFGRAKDGRYGRAPCPDLHSLRRLVVTQKLESVGIDLTAVGGFCSSKADLRSLPSLEAMVAKQGPLPIMASWDSSVSPAERIKRLLAHDQIRIQHNFNTETRATSSDSFRLNAWDITSRVFVMNDGGSHHLAHAATIARDAFPGEESGITLTAALEYRTLSPGAVMAFNRDYEAFLIPADDATSLMAVYDALESAEAEHVRMPFMPSFFNRSDHGGGRGPIDLVLLPRHSSRAMACADLFKQSGTRSLNTELDDGLRRCAAHAHHTRADVTVEPQITPIAAEKGSTMSKPDRTTPRPSRLAAAVAAAGASAAVAVLMGMPHAGANEKGIYWVQHAPTPFVDVGRNRMGAVEFDRLAVNWQRAGLSSQDAKIVLTKIDAFAPTVTSDISFMSARMAASADIAANLAAAYPQEASVLRDLAAGVDATATNPAKWDLQDLLELRASFDSSAWTTDPAATYLRNAMGNATTYGVDYVGAKEQMEYALQVTGAKAITIGHAFAQSPERMFAMAWAVTAIDDGLRNRHNAPFEGQFGLGHGGLHLNAGTVSSHQAPHVAGTASFTVRPATVGADWFSRLAMGAQFHDPANVALAPGLSYAAADLGARAKGAGATELPTLQDAFVVHAIANGRLSDFMDPAPYATWLRRDAAPVRRAIAETINTLETQYLASDTPPQGRDVAFLEGAHPVRISPALADEEHLTYAQAPSPR